MSKKYYVVWKGSQTGVFDNWATVQRLTAGRSDAQFMGFGSKAEAESAFQSSYTKALMQRSLAKGQSTNSSSSTKKASPPPAFNSELTPQTQIYCDGACSPNPGKSGTGIAVYNNKQLTALWYGLHQPKGTNNTAELNGMLQAFLLAKPLIEKGEVVEVLSDSKYSIDCITRWAKGWKSKGWTRGKGEEIKNLDIIKQCFTLYELLKGKLIISHVKGHANIEGNELSDRMAVYARMTQETAFTQYQQSLDISLILAMPSG